MLRLRHILQHECAGFGPCSLVPRLEGLSWLLPTIMDLARAKLLCQNKIDVAHNKVVKPHASTAVVDVRLMLSYEPRQEASRALEADLVASHMRMAYSVPQNREYIRSGYPSEPLLAEAAARQMRIFRLRDPNAILQILQDNLQSGLLDKGERGELVARELLISAYDRAIEREYAESTNRSSSGLQGQRDDHLSGDAFDPIPHYSRGVSAITFLEELFTPAYPEQILDSVPNNVKSAETLRSALRDATVRFTHFGKMADNTGTTTAATWAAFVRAMAIICRSGETGVDIIIPVLLSKSKLCEEVTTGILVQIKRRRAKGSIAKCNIDERTLKFFPDVSPAGAPTTRRPYISLVMELGVQNKPSPDAMTSTKAAARPPRQSTSQAHVMKTPSKVVALGQGRLRRAADCHPRYSIFAYGCSDTVYKGIRPSQRAVYQYLLASRDFLDEHPRKNPETLLAVRRMRPFWSAGPACYHWIEDARLQNALPDDNNVDDIVLTGCNVEEEFDCFAEGDDPFAVASMTNEGDQEQASVSTNRAKRLSESSDVSRKVRKTRKAHSYFLLGTLS
jgi:hypothetical protein